MLQGEEARVHLRIRTLEPRIVLDAAVVDADAHAPEVSIDVDGGDAGSSTPSTPDVPVDQAPDGPDAAQDGEGIDVVVVDSTLQDAHLIAEAVQDGAAVVWVDGTEQGAADILGAVEQVAAERGGAVDSLSLVTHGAGGWFAMGQDAITAETMADHAQVWQGFDDLLSAQGRINLFSCTLAQDGSGQSLLDAMADATGATIFASDDLTGAGGDWTLEAVSAGGSTSAFATPLDAIALESYGHSLVDLDADPTLVAWWRLDDANLSAADSSLGGDDMTTGLSGFPLDQSQWVQGVIGGGLQFDGNNDYLHVGDSNSINNMTVPYRTYSLWFKADNPTGGRQVLYEEGATVNGLGIYIDNGVIRAGGWNSAVGVWSEVAFTDTGAWHHLVWTLDGQTNDGDGAVQKLYLDNVLVDTDTVGVKPINNHGGDINLGRSDGESIYHDGQESSDFNFDGGLDDVRVYNRELSAGEVDALYLMGQDLEDPTATLTSAPDVNVGGSPTYVFQVTLADNFGVDVSDLDDTDLRVTGPGGFDAAATFLGVDNNTNGSPRVASYQILTPGGNWDAADNGTYSIVMQANEISDVKDNFVAGGVLGAFDVNITQVDTDAPVAVLDITDVVTANANNHTFTVTYTDNGAVDVSSIDGDEILVVGPGINANATLVSIDSALDGPQRIATYEIAPPGGTWDLADNGTYTLSLNNNAFGDVAGNPAPGEGLGGFNVNISNNTLVAHWTFDDGTGNVISDSSPSGDNMAASLVNFPAGDGEWVDGKVGGALDFDGVNDEIRPANSNFINTMNVYERTIALWYNADNAAGGRQVLFKEGGGTNGFVVYVESNKIYAGFWSSNFTTDHWLSTDIVDDGQWHHVALTYDSNTSDGDGNLQQLYYDNVMVDSYNGSGRISAHSGGISIGHATGSDFHNSNNDNNAYYYDGKIDDLRIYNAELSAGEVESLFALGNAAPDIGNGDLSLTSNTIDEGGAAVLSGSFTDADANDAHTVTINWGDGTANTTLNLAAGVTAFNNISHTYADQFTGNIVVTVQDNYASDFASIGLTAQNVAPTIALSGSGALNEGGAFGLTLGAVTDPGTDTATQYIVDWGDGTSDTYNTLGLKNHVYADDGAYTASVSVVDEDGTHAAAGTQAVTVNNVAPTIALSGSGALNEGGAFGLTLGAVTDPGTDTATQYIVDWGDGTSDTYNTLGLKNHVYADDGAYTASVSVVDEDGTHAAAGTQAVTVNNVIPTIALSGSGTTGEGSAFGLTLGAVTDPGADTATQYIVDWGDGASDTYTTLGVKNHVYADDGAYTASVSVVDEDGAHAAAGTQAVTVTNVAPVTTVAGTEMAIQGTAVDLTFTPVVDPGVDTLASYVIHWGDGETQTVTDPAQATHIYNAPGPYTVAVSLVDEDGTHLQVDTHEVTIQAIPVPPDDGLGPALPIFPDDGAGGGETGGDAGGVGGEPGGGGETLFGDEGAGGFSPDSIAQSAGLLQSLRGEVGTRGLVESLAGLGGRGLLEDGSGAGVDGYASAVESAARLLQSPRGPAERVAGLIEEAHVSAFGIRDWGRTEEPRAMAAPTGLREAPAFLGAPLELNLGIPEDAPRIEINLSNFPAPILEDAPGFGDVFGDGAPFAPELLELLGLQDLRGETTGGASGLGGDGSDAGDSPAGRDGPGGRSIDADPTGGVDGARLEGEALDMDTLWARMGARGEEDASLAPLRAPAAMATTAPEASGLALPPADGAGGEVDLGDLVESGESAPVVPPASGMSLRSILQSIALLFG